MITAVDVTLRDGGYRNNFHFTLDYAIRHVKESVLAGLDWIEIGYRNGSGKPRSDLGLTGRGENDYIRTLAEIVGPDRICMIVHPKNVSDMDLHQMYDSGVRLLRVCWPAADSESGFRIVLLAKQIGFTVSVNVTRVSQLSSRTFAQIVGDAVNAGCDVVCLADSNGSLLPHVTAKLIARVRAIAPVAVGLHAHDNLGLALANAIAAVLAGATWIDSSLLGMGKGPGNLRTEQWVAYWRCMERNSKYDLGRLLALAHTLEVEFEEAKPTSSLFDLVLGCFDLSVDDKSKLPTGRPDEAFAVARELAESLPAE